MNQIIQKVNSKRFSFFGLCSLVIGAAQWLFFMGNFIFYTSRQGQHVQEAYILLPMFLAPFGMLFARVNGEDDEMSKWGIIVNAVMFLLPFFYVLLGKLIAFL